MAEKTAIELLRFDFRRMFAWKPPPMPEFDALQKRINEAMLRGETVELTDNGKAVMTIQPDGSYVCAPMERGGLG